MRESLIEKKAVAQAKDKGWLSIKLSGAGDKGKPDRVFLKDGRAVFIEFKQKGKRPTKLQELWLERLREKGFTACVVDDVANIEVILEGMK